jgi:guanylate kinase
LVQRHPELYVSISVTTRRPRPGEVDGRDYYFVSESQFERMVANGELLEWAEFAGNFYGTPRAPVEEHIRRGDWVILEIELEGARQIRKTFPDALRLFVLPPSLAELEQRIRSRGQDSDDAIARRLQRAREEIAAADEFNLQIVNDNFDRAVQQVEDSLFAVLLPR